MTSAPPPPPPPNNRQFKIAVSMITDATQTIAQMIAELDPTNLELIDKIAVIKTKLDAERDTMYMGKKYYGKHGKEEDLDQVVDEFYKNHDRLRRIMRAYEYLKEAREEQQPKRHKKK